MRWKPSVKLELEESGLISYNGENKRLESGEIYIAKELAKDFKSEKELVSLVMETEKVDELAADFRLAEFVEKYGQWIETRSGDDVILVI